LCVGSRYGRLVNQGKGKQKYEETICLFHF